MDPKDIDNRFSFHPATTEEKQAAHGSARAECLALANFLNGALPDGREKSLAITHLEEVMFWSNAAIARVADAAPVA